MSNNKEQGKSLSSNPFDNFYQRIPFIGRFLHSDSRLRNFPFFDANERLRILNEYNLRSGADATKLPSETLFDTFNSGFIAEANQFADVKAPDGTLLSKVLADKRGDAHATAVENAIHTALKGPKKAMQLAVNEYKEDIEALRERIQKKATPATHVLSYLKARKESVQTELNDARDEAKRELEACFNDTTSGFSTSLQNTLNIGPAQVPGVKDAMLAEIDKKHQEASEAADKAFTDSTDALTKDTKRRQEESMLVASLYETSNRMKDEIDKLIAQKRQQQQSLTQLTTDVNIGGITLKDIRIGDLPFVALGTGLFPKRDLKVEKGPTGEVSVSMELPSELNIPYWMDPRSNAESDMTRFVTVLCVVTPPGKKPRVDVTHTNPEVALQMGRLAFGALRKNGIAEADCLVYVNGEKKSAAELFAGRSEQLTSINTAADKENAAKNAAESADPTNSARNLKQDIADIRAQKKAAAAATPPSGPVPGGTL